ncbi:hypothetical protein [Pedobacter namyangjuensis]|uniref:hypothetical protein n=1 Tax=Pedobacter namyangjuensis TaxID=600626 RepID=UPI000DE41CE5|nr:hypothetical protein [Pedobacter namyangjuensis]
MIRINDETPTETLQEVKVGDMITDGFSKTGRVESVEIEDDGLYKVYEFYLNTDRVISTKR